MDSQRENGRRDWRDRDRDEERGWFDRARDDVREWFRPDDRDEFRYGSRYHSGASDRYRPYPPPNETSRGDAWSGTEYRAYGGYGSRAGDRFGFHGRGPKGFQRSDERIREDVAQFLTESPELDATEIEIEVKDRKVTLAGSVHNRREKRLAEDLAERVWGVEDVRNELRVDAGREPDREDRDARRSPRVA